VAPSLLEPILLERCTEVPAGANWLYEVNNRWIPGARRKKRGRILLRSRTYYLFDLLVQPPR